MVKVGDLFVIVNDDYKKSIGLIIKATNIIKECGVNYFEGGLLFDEGCNTAWYDLDNFTWLGNCDTTYRYLIPLSPAMKILLGVSDDNR